MMDYAKEQKKNLPWETFVYDTKSNPTLLGIDRIKETYESSKTWQEFFLYVRSQLGVSKFCICLSDRGWFDNFILTRLRFSLMTIPYLIDVSVYDTEYTLAPMTGGKKRSKGVQRWRHTLRKSRSH